MAQKSKEKQQIQQEILDNRRAIQRCEVQMSGVRTLIASAFCNWKSEYRYTKYRRNSNLL